MDREDFVSRLGNMPWHWYVKLAIIIDVALLLIWFVVDRMPNELVRLRQREDQGDISLDFVLPAMKALSETALYTLVVTLVLAFLIAIVLDATRDFGLRALLHRFMVDDWLRSNPGTGDVTSSMMALPADELAGQLAALMRTGSSDAAAPHAAHQERALDRLQVRLRARDAMLELLLAIYIAAIFALATLSAGRTRLPWLVIVAVAVTAGLITPLARSIVQRVTRGG